MRIPMQRSMLIVVVCVCGCALARWSRGEPPAEADPVAIERIELPPERLAAEMERVRQKVLARLPRDEFEELVRRAGAAVASAKSPPRLVEARYRAALVDHGLVGSAEWKIVHTASGPGRLPLSSLQLALRSAHWPGDRPAILGQLDDRRGASLELLVEKQGESTLALEWSARGLPEPTGLRFDLRFPPSPVALLELDVPADVTPLADREGCLIAGPFPANSADRKMWRVSFPGRPSAQADPIPLLLQRPSQKGRLGPLLRPSIQTSVKLSPGIAECDYDIDLLVQRGSVRELDFECDAGIRPYELSVAGLEEWETKTAPDGKTIIHTRLRDAFQGGRASVRALAALPDSDAWTCPALRVVGGIPRDETLTLRVHSDLQLDDWKSGSFRWIDSHVSADRFQVLSMRSALGGSARPQAKIRASGAVFDVRESVDWQTEPDGSSLTARLHFLIRRGVLFQVPLIVPPGWEVDQVEATPADSTLRWTPPAAGATGGTLTIEPSHPLAVLAGAKDDDPNHFRLTVRLRAAGIHWKNGPDGDSARLPFPDLVPAGARQREGTLALHVGPTIQANVKTTLPQIRPDVYSFRGPIVEGSLLLRRRAGGLQANCQSEAEVRGHAVRNVFRLELAPAGKLPDELIFATSADISGKWSWKTLSGVGEVVAIAPTSERDVTAYLALLGVDSPAQAPALLATARMMDVALWRLKFDRPLRLPVTLELAAESKATDSLCEVPLLTIPAAVSAENVAIVKHAEGNDWDAEMAGVREILPRNDAAFTERRVFHYRGALPGLRLIRPATPTPRGDSTLILSPSRQGGLIAQYVFRVWGWRDSQLPVRLPPHATLLHCEVSGRSEQLTVSDDGELLIPRTSMAALEGTITYNLPTRMARPMPILRAREPQLPFAVPVQRIWRIPNGLAPLAPELWRQRTQDAARRDGITEWEAPAGESGERMTLTRPAVMTVLGVSLAGLFAVAALAGWSLGWHHKRSFLLFALVVAGFARLWLPGGLRELAIAPLIAATAAVFVALLAVLPWLSLAAPVTGNPPIRSTVSVPLVLAAVLGLAFTGRAAAPGPTPVYLVTSDSEPHSVLAPPELIDRLHALTRAGAPTAGAVILASKYTGRIDGETAHVDARFSIQCLRDAATTLTVPLSGVLLRDALLDGKTALPNSDRTDHYRFTVMGKGAHSLALQFDVPAPAGLDREVRFGVPELPINALTLLGPPGAQQLQAMTWRGAQHTLTDSAGPRLEADLGRLSSVHVRWHQPGNEPAVKPKVQEFGLWDIAESSAHLLTVYRYQLGTSHVSELEFDLPDGLELAKASVKPLDDRATAAGITGLRDIDVSDKPNRLRLEFQTPLTGQNQVTLELVPREPLELRPLLLFPTPIAVGERVSQVAVRVRGWESTVIDSAGLAPVGSDTFHDQWKSLRVDAALRPPASAFRVPTGGTAALRIALQPLPDASTATQNVTWNVGPGRAEFRALAAWSGSGPVRPVEFALPANLVLAEVRSRDLRFWWRSGSRLQVWLDRAVEDSTGGSTLELTGWLPRSTDEAVQEKTPFILPLIEMRGSAAELPRVRVEARPGWRLRASQVEKYLPLPDIDLPGESWTAIATNAGNKAIFQLNPVHGSAEFRSVSILDTTSNQAGFRSIIEAQPVPGKPQRELNTIEIELRRAEGMNASLAVPPGARLREGRAVNDGMIWVVDMAPGPHRFVINGQRPTGSKELAIPVVTARCAGPEPGRNQRWVVTAGPWRSREVAGVRIVPSTEIPGSLLGAIPAGATWRVEQDDWRISLEPASHSTARSAAPPVEVRLAPDEIGRWLLDVRIAADHAAESRWSIFPGANDLLALSIDGRELPLRSIDEHAPLPLPSGAGVSSIRMVCRSPVRVEEGLRGIAIPQLEIGSERIEFGPTFWTICAPAGERARVDPAVRLSAAAFDARRAIALNDFARSISDRVGPDSLRAIRNRAACVALAAESRPGFAEETGPDGQSLRDLLKPLREARPAPTEAPDRPWPSVLADRFESGTRAYAQTNAGMTPAVAFELPNKSDPLRIALSGMLGLVLVGGLIWAARERASAR